MGNILYKSVKFVTRYLQLDYQDIKTHTCDECDCAFSATSSSILCFKVKLLLRCCSESVAGSKGMIGFRYLDAASVASAATSLFRTPTRPLPLGRADMVRLKKKTESYS